MVFHGCSRLCQRVLGGFNCVLGVLRGFRGVPVGCRALPERSMGFKGV